MAVQPASWLQAEDVSKSMQAGSNGDDDMADIDMLSNAFSRILLKGERYQAPVGLQQAHLLEDWSWHGNPREYCPIRYLDASCMLFGADQEFLEVVDYQRKASTARAGPPGAVTHSGDRLQEAERTGQHRIDIALAQLGPQVVELFLTLSAYGPARLSDILRPTVSMLDAAGQPLCAYELEQQPPEQLSASTSCIMCRIHRTSEGWAVEAIGQLGAGNASNYGPMLETIKHVLPMADALRKWGF